MLDSLGSDQPVFRVPVDGMIDGALAAYIDRAISDAEKNDASAVVLDIDTFGGLVDAADEIRKTLLNAEPTVVALIDKNAASAGALISYAADYIVMVPGASIGAATVVEGVGGEAAPDKYQSYMRGLMRSTAEANGRDPRIAEAMVDESISIEGVTLEGQVLTLSTREAVELGVADAEVDGFDDVLAMLQAASAPVVLHRVKPAEKALRFFASPILQSILMLMMLGGLYFEMQTPGVGFAGLMAMLGAAAFFGPHYLLGLVESWEIVMFVLGVVLLLVEILVIPGFGFAGIGGLILVVFSLGASLIGNVGLDFPSGEAISSAVLTLAVTMVLFVVLLFSAARWIPNSKRFSQLVLVPDLSAAGGFTSFDDQVQLVGMTGRTLTPLRPSGMAMIDDKRVDVITHGEYIDGGVTVEVMSARGSRIVVREVSAA
ncbi:MAG: hypothetical protein HKN17_02995 [Rhodothermales bacterium]|nr:hypothetical protein [Rhodothermales bacterium]